MTDEQSKVVSEAIQRRNHLLEKFGSIEAVKEIDMGVAWMQSVTKWVHVGDIPGDVVATAIGYYLLYRTPMPVGVQWLWEANQ